MSEPDDDIESTTSPADRVAQAIRQVLEEAGVKLQSWPPPAPEAIEELRRFYTPLAVRRLVRPFGGDAEALRTAVLDSIRYIRAKVEELIRRDKTCWSLLRPYRPVAGPTRAVVHCLTQFPMCVLAIADDSQGQDPEAPGTWWKLTVVIMVENDALDE
jgi:hypothetical protein